MSKLTPKQFAIAASMSRTGACADFDTIVSKMFAMYGKDWNTSKASIKHELEDMIRKDFLDMDVHTRKVSQGPLFQTLMQDASFSSGLPLLEVDYRIKGVRFTQAEIDQLRYELVPMTDVVDMRHPPSLVRRSYTIKGVEFTQAELARLFSLLVVNGAATQSGGGYQTPHGYPFFNAGQRR